jgi:hypothetical protein
MAKQSIRQDRGSIDARPPNKRLESSRRMTSRWYLGMRWPGETRAGIGMGLVFLPIYVAILATLAHRKFAARSVSRPDVTPMTTAKRGRIDASARGERPHSWAAL